MFGKNNANSGTPIGTEGAVPNGVGYGLSTPYGARIEGLLDTDGTDFVVEVGATATADGKNVVLGHADNQVNDGATATAIGGGGTGNVVYDNCCTLAGGKDNQAGTADADATSAEFAFAGGGNNQTGKDDGDATGVTHVGPMAGESHETFGVGDGETVASVDADGVAFAAIRGLSARLEKKDDRIDDLERENDELRERPAESRRARTARHRRKKTGLATAYLPTTDPTSGRPHRAGFASDVPATGSPHRAGFASDVPVPGITY